MDDTAITVVGEDVYVEVRETDRTVTSILTIEELARMCMEYRELGREIAKSLKKRDFKRLRRALGL